MPLGRPVIDNGNMERAESKIASRSYYQPGAGGVEGMPLTLQTFHQAPLVMLKPHWHAQVEVNFVIRGSVRYRMSGHGLSLRAGEMCLFWGGLPHRMDDASEDAFYAGCHLPLVHFFRLNLPAKVRHRLMTGATLVTDATDPSDIVSFERWDRYARSGDVQKAEHAVSELLLRLERVRFDAYRLASAAGAQNEALQLGDPQSLGNVGRMCDFIAENFLENIDCLDIAAAAEIHPKYAMSLFRKSTGMTLNEYLSLLRLSYAQALLMKQGANVLAVAMDSGFGSLSAFNKSFRKLAGMSPSDFRKVTALRRA